MPKRRRPKRRPEESIEPVESHEIGEAGREVRHVRASAWAVLALVALMGNDASIPRPEVDPIEKPAVAASAEPAMSKPGEGLEAQWMERIQLPSMGEIGPLSVDLMDRLPKGVDRERLVRFDAQCRQWFEEAEKELPGVVGDEARQRRIFDLMSQVIQAYKVAVGDTESENFEIGSIPFAKLMQRINGVLLPFGDCIHESFDHSSKTRVTWFQAVRRAEVRIGDGLVPLVYVSRRHALVSVPGSPAALFNGELNPPSGIAALCEEGAEGQMSRIMGIRDLRFAREGKAARPIDWQKALQGSLALPAYHEAAHVYFGKRVVFDARRFDGINNKMEIPMGNYRLPGALLLSANNARLHELFANGIGLMKSGGSAVLAAHSIATNESVENYTLAREVLWQELLNDPEIDPALRSELRAGIARTGTVNFDKMVLAIDSLSDKSLHRIGERMAKVALRISDPDGEIWR